MLELILDDANGKNVISSIDEHSICVNQKPYPHSLIITPDEIKPWDIHSVTELSDDHIKTLLRFNPEILLLGTGKTLVSPPASLLEFIYRHSKGLEIMTSAACARTYDVLVAEKRHVVAGIIIES